MLIGIGGRGCFTLFCIYSLIEVHGSDVNRSFRTVRPDHDPDQQYPGPGFPGLCRAAGLRHRLVRRPERGSGGRRQEIHGTEGSHYSYLADNH